MDFHTTEDAPIILIGGMNGRGKTTLLDALQLALYGRRSPTARKFRGSYDEFLRELVHSEAQPPESAVTLSFTLIEDGHTKLFEVARRWSSTSGRNSTGESVQVKVDGVLDNVSTERWDEIVESILPQEIAQLFFFDGEKIEQLADPVSSAKVVETAINSLLGLGVVDRLKNDLSTIRRRWTITELDETARIAIDEMESRIEKCHRELTEKVQLQASLQNRVDVTAIELQSAQDRFSQGGGDLAADLDAIDDELRAAKSEQSLLHQQVIDLVGGALPLEIVKGLRSRALERATIEQGLELDRLTNERLVQRDSSLLGSFNEARLGATLFGELVAFLEQDRSHQNPGSEVAPFLKVGIQGGACLNHAHLRLKTQLPQASELNSQLTKSRERIRNLDRRLEAVPPEEVVARLRAALTQAAQMFNGANAELELAIASVEESRHSLSNLESQLERLVEKHAASIVSSEDKERMKLHANRAQETLERFRKELLLRHLATIEAAVLDSFNEILGKSDLIQGLTICPDSFTMTLVGPSSEAIPAGRLSAGERQLLATSLLWGLARVSGRRLPMVVDTPLGRLDSTHRASLVDRYFPSASSQMIILSTDEEIDDELLEGLKSSISRSYTLLYDHGSRSSSIQAGYFGEFAHVG